ncbi:LacI family transcriptional regulator [Cohaesibacter celericrescens]|uniref:LacI family transcriptional regulator n=1 Tax=Cohaesibacter celericrescens TaxID=2067669 RepID=UPI0035639CFA
MALKRPTLKTISELSGFAVTTVSRALSDGPEIGAETKKKVRKIADDIGYVRNRSGVGLVTGKSNVISLILSADHDVIDDHTGRLIASIARHLQGTLYHMNIVTYATQTQRLEVVKHVVETRSADAVILSQIEPDDQRIAYLLERQFPFVAYGRSNWKEQHAFFDFDNIAFGTQAARILIEKGRKRLLFISPPDNLSYSKDIYKGIEQGLLASDARVEILEGASSHDGNEAMRKALVQRFSQPGTLDGIIAPSTSSAVVSIAALEQSGLVLGKDVDIFAKEASPYLQYIRKEVMSVYENLTLAGEFLAKAALQAIDDPAAPPMHRLELSGDHLSDSECKPV